MASLSLLSSLSVHPNLLFLLLLLLFLVGLVEPPQAPLEGVGRAPLARAAARATAAATAGPPARASGMLVVFLHRLDELGHLGADLLAHIGLDARRGGLRLGQARAQRLHLRAHTHHVHVAARPAQVADEVGAIVAFILVLLVVVQRVGLEHFAALALCDGRGRRLHGVLRVVLSVLGLVTLLDGLV